MITILALAAFLGLLWGSLANAMIYRYPKEIPMGIRSHRRSFCPHCKKQIAWYDNLPLLSYLILRGKCRTCGWKIPKLYPAVELLMSALFTLTAYLFVRSSILNPGHWSYWAELLKVEYFVFSLVTLSFIDLECQLIPDRFSIGNWVIALGAAFLWHEPSFTLSLLGGFVGAAFFFVMAWSFEKLKGIEGLGMGDVKMIGWLGAWLGLANLPMIIVVSSLSGVVIGLVAMRKAGEGLRTAIPFGPFLAIAAYIVWAIKTFSPDVGF